MRWAAEPIPPAKCAKSWAGARSGQRTWKACWRVSKESKYLDDRQFAEGYATARLSNERFGKTRVLQDLRHRRVAPALAEKTVHAVYQDVDESALIEEWIRRKYRTTPREGLFQEDKDLASAYRRLLRAGFRTGEIVRVLKKFAANPELLDNFEPPEEAEE